jgi:hypothetical protein
MEMGIMVERKGGNVIRGIRYFFAGSLIEGI